MNPCVQCPWRKTNQGKPHPSGFYTKKNLRRLWGNLRRGGMGQSCHLTDPSHPDHVKAGAPENGKPQECPGSVVLIIRELKRLEALGTNGVIDQMAITKYMATRKRGLTRTGLVYWIMQRVQFAGTLLGKQPLPEVNWEDPAIDLPDWLKE